MIAEAADEITRIEAEEEARKRHERRYRELLRRADTLLWELEQLMLADIKYLRTQDQKKLALAVVKLWDDIDPDHDRARPDTAQNAINRVLEAQDEILEARRGKLTDSPRERI